MAHYRALMLPTSLALTAGVLALVGWGTTDGLLGVLTTRTGYHCRGGTGGAGACMAHTCTGMLSTVQ